MQDTIVAFLRRRPAVHQLCVGAWVQSAFELGDGVLAVPLKPAGFISEVHYLARYANEMVGAPVDVAAIQTLVQQTAAAQSVVALCLPLPVDAPADALEASAHARLERARSVLAWISARDVTPIGMVVATTAETYFRPLPPDSGHRQFLFGLGGSREQYQAAVLRIAERSKSDDRFAFALSLYHDALREPVGPFRIARMFNVLECLAGKLKGTDQPSRKAVKHLLGLPDGAMVEMQFGASTYRFDCIEVAGRLRDKLFHGTRFREFDLDTQSRSAFALLVDHPDDIAKIVSSYCELELSRWANGKSLGQVPDTPERDR